MPDASRVCIDRILSSQVFSQFRTEIVNGRPRAISPIGKVWPTGVTLKIGFLGGTDGQKQFVEDIANEWTDHANLHFEFIDAAPQADIRISFKNSGAWSYIGTDAKLIHRSRATMNLGWLDEAVVLHEVGHGIGLAHEHQNPEGGIEWDEEVVIRDLSGPPNFWDIETIRHNVLRKYSIDHIHGTVFDPESVMLYSFPAEWTVNGFSTSFNDDLSDLDKSFIASEKMYPGRVPDLIEIPVGNLPRVAASIGQPGEEDLFVFEVADAGPYTVQTEGDTDMVMRLYGPDSRTALVAEDDDGGTGRNARIMRHLEVGEYIVQVRHWNMRRGTGDYAVMVYR